VNLLGGVMGALLAGVLLVAEVSRKVYPERFEGQESLGYFERLQSGFSAEQLVVIGIAVLVGALTNLTVTIMLFAVLYASLWSIND
jgi:H+/Cl- antiporter ClcA